MTAPSLLDELASEEKWLRQAAGEIASEGHNGWGNTCSQAADCIKRTHAALADMAKRLEAAERDASPGRCKACGRATRSVCDGLDGNGLGCTNAPPIDIAATQDGEG